MTSASPSGPSRFVLGIDASRAVTDAPTGTEYYSRALIEALLSLEDTAFLRLYTRTTPPPAFFPLTERAEIRTIRVPRLWTHLGLSYEMAIRAPDALWVPAHVLPVIHPPNSLVTVHDLGFKYYPGAHPLPARLYLDWSTRWSARAVRTVIADSACTRDDLIKYYGISSEKIRIVYPGYNASIFKPVPDPTEIARVRARYNLASSYLVSVGTLHPRKNYSRLIEAFGALEFDGVLVIVGKKGWRADEIVARASALGLGERVRFLDYVPVQDLPCLYTGAQLAVLPSLYEGFGFPALEAQACRTPLACSNASSLPEVAGQGAVYFDPLDIADMSRVLANVLEDETFRRGLVARGYENVRHFTWERAAREILAISRASRSRREIPNHL